MFKKEAENIKTLSKVSRKENEILEVLSRNIMQYRQNQWRRPNGKSVSISNRVASLTQQLSKRYTIQIIQLFNLSLLSMGPKKQFCQ